MSPNRAGSTPSHRGGYRLFLTASLGLIDYAYSLTPGFKDESADVMMVYSCTPWGLQIEKILNTPEHETYKLICIYI